MLTLREVADPAVLRTGTARNTVLSCEFWGRLLIYKSK